MFTTTQVGSWPRSRKMLQTLREYQAGRTPRSEFDQVADEEVVRTVRLQEKAGLDIIVDGEHRRDSFYSFVTDKVEGTKLMSLADLLDYVENKAEFEEMLQTLDVPASSIKNPTCVDRLSRRETLAVNDLRFVRKISKKPVKITLPGPYLLTRSMWVSHFTSKVYENHKKMAVDVVKFLREELADLQEEGCDFVQFDEPVLTEITMSEETKRRTFM